MSKSNGFFGEFKKFITRGNVLDMAVGVIVGAAFSAIVNSLVKDILNPIIGLITGGKDFGTLKIVLKPAQGEVEELAIRYGLFINSIINFVIFSFILFLIVRSFNHLRERAEEAKKKQVEEAPAAPPKKSDDVLLLEEIRDLLKAGKAK